MKNIIRPHDWVKSFLFLLLFFPLMTVSAQNLSLKDTAGDEKNIPTVPADAKMNKLEAVQPVAYGSTTRRANTSSVSSVDGSQLTNSVSALGSALYAKLPGLFLQQGSGEPGNDGPLYYFIRGRVTTGSASNQPMYFVDGFERDINTVQVEDVENVSVLKDAAATALYGARGANGVIMVTTKRGHEGKPRFTANVQYGMQSPNVKPTFLSSYDYANKYRRAYEMDYVPWALINGTAEEKAPYLSSLPERYKEENAGSFKTGDPYYYPDIDWARELTSSSAPRRQVDINASGGDKTSKYYISVNYLGVDGLYTNCENYGNGKSSNADLNRIRYRANVDVNITGNWTFKADMSGQIDTKNGTVASATDLWNSFYKTPSDQFPIKVNGSLYGGTSLYTVNPLAELESRGFSVVHSRSMMTTVETVYDLGWLLNGLRIGARFAYDNKYSSTEGWSRTYQVAEVLGKDETTGNPILGNAVGTQSDLAYFGPQSDAQNDRTTLEGFAEFNRNFGKNAINSMLMYHQDRYIVDGESKPYKYQFGGGRLGYNYDKKYFGEFSFSYSGTESFAQSKRFGFFPAISAGWMISEEEFMKSVGFIDYFKLRGSAGIVGNSAVGERFSYVKQYTGSTGWVFGNTNTWVTGWSDGTYPNTNFTFETAYKYEVGVDANFLNALNFWGNIYLERRVDILNSALVPNIAGLTLANVNNGITERKGVELGFIFSKNHEDWGYSVGLNGSLNVNKIVKINEEIQPYDYLYTQGKAIGQPFMLESIGFFKDPEDIADSPSQEYGTVHPGDIKYKDQNGDGKINNYDKKAFFNPILPKAELGLDLSFRFRCFDAAAFFQSQLCRSVSLLSSPYIFCPLQNNSARISTYAVNSWTPETAETADYPRLTTLSNSNNYQASTFWYKNGDFLRLRSVELGYSMPSSFLQKYKIKKTRLFVRGMNLFTWDHICQVDPEVLTGYPVLKSYNVGLTLQF